MKITEKVERTINLEVSEKELDIINSALDQLFRKHKEIEFDNYQKLVIVRNARYPIRTNKQDVFNLLDLVSQYNYNLQ